MLAENLERIRTAKGFNKSELARKASVSYRTVENIENGKNSNPTLKILVALAKALETTIDNLANKIGKEE